MKRFEAVFASGRKALGVYLTVGDPNVELTIAAAKAAIDAGADFIELGAPFSDPSADGPAIQRAMERALKQGVKFTDVVRAAREIRAGAKDAPIVLFGYANPYLRAQQRGELAALAETIDGLLLVDVPPEHDHDFQALAGKVARIRLLGPNATVERRAVVAKAAEGFIYVVAYAGVTGAQAGRDVAGLTAQVSAMRALTNVPLCAGFGVKSKADAAALGPVADGVIAGSVFVEALAGATSTADAASVTSKIVRALRDGLDGR